MTAPGALSNIENLELSDTDPDDLFASPSRSEKKVSSKKSKGTAAATSSIPTKSIADGSRHDTEEAREVALRKELEGVRNINEVIEGVIRSLDRAKENMETVSRTVNSASTLLNTWIRILSQTEHNQRLILNPSWQGASQDVEDLENESILKQQATERREAEERQRREAAARKAEDDERRRAESAASRGSRGTRGRGRGAGRGTSSGSAGYVGVGGQGGVRGSGRGSSSALGRAGSGIGRGSSVTRGRGRGT
ncbi:MAG: hypothetical protein M1835_006690 [Candelina submexicana]|nr:MAG: hypothetical protein M1835_006690 [Candelina submexicana]